MEVGIHAAALVHDRLAGVERYVRELLPALFSLPESTWHHFTLFAPESVLRERGTQDHISEYVVRVPFLFTQAGLSFTFLRKKLDAFFVPAHVLPRVLPGKTIVTIHGLEFEQFPWAYSVAQRLWLRAMTKDAVKRAYRIIAISESTRQELEDRYHIPHSKIVVIPHGLNRTKRIPSNHKTTSRPYFLYLGRLETKKNILGLLRAFTTFKTITRAPHRLLLAGSPGFGAKKILRAIAKNRAKNDIVYLNYIPEGVREELLFHATAFVFPSWAEGFGMPILEAQAHGVSVIASNTTAMPEVAGDAALLVPPDDPERLADAMRKIVSDEKLRTDLIFKGFENIKRFSWENTAKATLDVLTQ